MNAMWITIVVLSLSVAWCVWTIAHLKRAVNHLCAFANTTNDTIRNEAKLLDDVANAALELPGFAEAYLNLKKGTP